MIATIGGSSRKSDHIDLHCASSRYFLILFFFIILFSSPNVNIACATLERGIVMVGINEIVEGWWKL